MRERLDEDYGHFYNHSDSIRNFVASWNNLMPKILRANKIISEFAEHREAELQARLKQEQQAIASLVMVAFGSAIFTPAEAAKYRQSNRGVFVQSQTQSQTSTTGGGGGGGDGPDRGGVDR